MKVLSVFKADLLITSKATAREFYKGVKAPILIPYEDDYYIRVEPGNHISVITKESVKNSTACFTPAWLDNTGEEAYSRRKYINAYLKGMME